MVCTLTVLTRVITRARRSKMDTCPDTIAFRPLISAICPPAPVAPSSLVRSTPKFGCKLFQPSSAQENYSLFLNRSPSFCIVVGSIVGSWALHMPKVEYLGVLSRSAFSSTYLPGAHLLTLVLSSTCSRYGVSSCDDAHALIILCITERSS